MRSFVNRAGFFPQIYVQKREINFQKSVYISLTLSSVEQDQALTVLNIEPGDRSMFYLAATEAGIQEICPKKDHEEDPGQTFQLLMREKTHQHKIHSKDQSTF